jgi:hypothetical protein
MLMLMVVMTGQPNVLVSPSLGPWAQTTHQTQEQPLHMPASLDGT